MAEMAPVEADRIIVTIIGVECRLMNRINEWADRTHQCFDGRVGRFDTIDESLDHMDGRWTREHGNNG